MAPGILRNATRQVQRFLHVQAMVRTCLRHGFISPFGPALIANLRYHCTPSPSFRRYMRRGDNSWVDNTNSQVHQEHIPGNSSVATRVVATPRSATRTLHFASSMCADSCFDPDIGSLNHGRIFLVVASKKLSITATCGCSGTANVCIW